MHFWKSLEKLPTPLYKKGETMDKPDKPIEPVKWWEWEEPSVEVFTDKNIYAPKPVKPKKPRKPKRPFRGAETRTKIRAE